ncbi:MAG: phage terminase large subunit [Methanoregula sp.]|nr:phage terminase large subunit [Methanoregula sp.]
MSLQVSQPDAASELLNRRKARSSLLEFTRYTKDDYEVNWHHQLLCEYLDKFVSGKIKRLLVFMPPRHGKSELVSRRLPAYIFGKCPDASIISCSYSADLASMMNRDVQRIIDSQKYIALFPDTKLNQKNIRTDAKGNFLKNSDIFEVIGHRGVYRSAGVNGGITGMGCNFGIIDDPIKNREEANSPTYRERVWNWYTSTFFTRLEKDAQILITQTRWHEDDLSGRILSLVDDNEEKWTVIQFPAIAEGEGQKDDPREIGEALWPNKYSTSRLEAIKSVVGSYEFAALYQQRPAPAEGGLFKHHWFSIVDSFPSDCRKIRRWDLSATSGKGDWTAGLLLGERNGIFYVIDLKHVQENPAGVESLIHQTAVMDTSFVGQRMEQEPGSSGVNTIDHYARYVLKGFDFKGVRSTGSKIERARPVSAAAEAGNIRIVKGPWNATFLDEVTIFPNGAHDDIVDTLSGAFSDLTLGNVRNFENEPKLNEVTAEDKGMFSDDMDFGWSGDVPGMM